MDKLFPVVPDILSGNGVFYLLVLEENKPGKVINIGQNLIPRPSIDYAILASFSGCLLIANFVFL